LRTGLGESGKCAEAAGVSAMVADPVRVVIIDPSEAVGASLGRWLRSRPMIHCEGVTRSAAALQRMVHKHHPDVVVMEVDGKESSSLDAVRRLGHGPTQPPPRVLILTDRVDAEHVDAAVGAGAWGYVSKLDDIAEVESGVLALVRGEVYLSPRVRRWLRGAIGPQVPPAAPRGPLG
jgi:DNA-binding NarL/FixJ family response regulator